MEMCNGTNIGWKAGKVYNGINPVLRCHSSAWARKHMKHGARVVATRPQSSAAFLFFIRLIARVNLCNVQTDLSSCSGCVGGLAPLSLLGPSHVEAAEYFSQSQGFATMFVVLLAVPLLIIFLKFRSAASPGHPNHSQFFVVGKGWSKGPEIFEFALDYGRLTRVIQIGFQCFRPGFCSLASTKGNTQCTQRWSSPIRKSIYCEGIGSWTSPCLKHFVHHTPSYQAKLHHCPS